MLEHVASPHESARTTGAQALSARLLRASLALVFLWFGALKLRPTGSVIETLAADTLYRLSGGRVRDRGVRALGVLECAVGLALLSGRGLRLTLAIMGLHLAGTTSPLAIFPGRCFTRPWRPTTEGQYIVKNVVLAAAGLELAVRAHRDGGGKSADARAEDRH